MYGLRTTKEKGERFLRKRRHGERVWRCTTSQYILYHS